MFYIFRKIGTLMNYQLTDIISVSPSSGEPLDSIVILLHGYGADNKDLIDIGYFWAPHLPHTAFIAPNAPEPCAQNPFGFQWFDIGNLAPEVLQSGVKKALPALELFIDDLIHKHNISEKRIVVMGFSQGGMMALAAGLKRGLGGIMSYSGVLVGGEHSVPTALEYPPIMLVHGNEDAVIPSEAFQHTQAVLKEHSISHEAELIHGLGHGIDRQGLDLGVKFLKKLLV